MPADATEGVAEHSSRLQPSLNLNAPVTAFMLSWLIHSSNTLNHWITESCILNQRFKVYAWNDSIIQWIKLLRKLWRNDWKYSQFNSTIEWFNDSKYSKHSKLFFMTQFVKVFTSRRIWTEWRFIIRLCAVCPPQVWFQNTRAKYRRGLSKRKCPPGDQSMIYVGDGNQNSVSRSGLSGLPEAGDHQTIDMRFSSDFEDATSPSIVSASSFTLACRIELIQSIRGRLNRPLHFSKHSQSLSVTFFLGGIGPWPPLANKFVFVTVGKK